MLLMLLSQHKIFCPFRYAAAVDSAPYATRGAADELSCRLRHDFR